MKPMNKGPKGPMGKAQKGEALKTLKRLFQVVVKKYPIHCAIVLLCIVISSLTGVASTLFLKNLIDDYITPFIGQTNPSFALLFQALVIMGCIYMTGVVSTYVYSRLMVNVTQGTLRDIRNSLFNHMESLPIKYFDTHTHGDIMSVYTNDTDTLRQMLSQSIPQLIASAITITGVFISMVVLSIPLTLLIVVCIAFMVIVTKKLGSKSAYFFMNQQQDIAKVNGYIEEMMEGQKVVKVFCHEEETKADFNKLNDQLFDSAKNANTFANVLMPVLNNLGYINFVLTAILGSILAINEVGTFTLGGLAAFLQLTRSFNQPISQISQQFNSIIMALAGAKRIFELMDQESETDDGYVTLVNAKIEEDGTIEEVEEHTGEWAWKYPHQDGTVTYTKLCGDVVFDDVDFGYNDEKIVLHNVKLFAEPGQKVAFVGATGAGKTTITNLINRFYDIQDGKIRYDGININKIKKDDLRSSLGIVLQDTHLFTGTVKENIMYGKLNATDEEVYAAAKLANADTFIKHLPEGYDTMLSGDGSNLSQGQRQLLAIARAAIADPPVLILDEATSSIDTRTEAIVQAGMDQLMEGRTVFVIAHRLSTVKNSDVIMVLEQGRIIERGNHDKLIEERGKYYQLYTGAFELA
ncbi:MAG: ABC transporter ATP-binding protein [bacterium]|nr:ABC transporter ATP-binding protein [bacterium]